MADKEDERFLEHEEDEEEVDGAEEDAEDEGDEPQSAGDDDGISGPSHQNQDATEAAAVNDAGEPEEEEEEEEELPEEKAFTGEVKMLMPNGIECTVKFSDGEFPAWLPHLLADDFFYFSRAIGLTKPKEKRKKRIGHQRRAASNRNTGEEEGEAEMEGNEDDEEERGEAGAQDAAEDAPAATDDYTADEGEEGEGEALSNAGPNRFNPNMMFALTLTDENALIYDASIYVPPKRRNDDEEEGEDPRDSEPETKAAPGAAKGGDDDDDDEDENGSDHDGSDAEAAPSGSARQGRGTGAGNAAAAAAAEAEEESEEEEAAETVLVDALTLAAIFSVDVLRHSMSLPQASTKTLSDFCALTVGHRSVIVDNLVAAQQQALATSAATRGSPPRRIRMDFAWLWRRLAADAGLLPSVRSYTQRLLAANVVPVGGISPALLTTAAAVRSYVHFLWCMPKSALVKIIAPVSVDGEEEEENGGAADHDDDDNDEENDGGERTAARPRHTVSGFLGQLLLDLRRRMARKKAGKRNLRRSPEETHRDFFPKHLEDKKDFIIANGYGSRTYVPEQLQLCCSDLALVMLAMAPAEFADATFARLLDMKLAIPRAPDSNTGMYHLLMHSLSEVTELAASRTIARIPTAVFEPAGLVDARQFVSEALDDYFSYVEPFSRRFWQPLVADKSLLAHLKQTHAKMHAAVVQCSEHYLVLLDSIGKNRITLSEFQRYEQRLLNPEVTTTPFALFTALDARNFEIARYLIAEKHVTFVQEQSPQGKKIPALEWALHRNDVATTHFLIDVGLPLTEMFDHGRWSALMFLEDEWVSEDTGEDAEALRAAIDRFRAVERDRGSDPSLKFGLLRSVPLGAAA